MKKADARARSAVAESNRRRAEAQGAKNSAMVRELVLASGLGGIAMSEIESRLAISNTAIRKHLMRLRSAGVVERTHDGGQACRWGPPGIYDAFAEQRARAARKPRKLSGWERLQKELEADQWADEPALRVIVRAVDAIPLGKPGPASVWEWR